MQDITKRKEAERVLLEARILAGEAGRVKSAILTNMSRNVRVSKKGGIGLADSRSERL